VSRLRRGQRGRRRQGPGREAGRGRRRCAPERLRPGRRKMRVAAAAEQPAAARPPKPATQGHGGRGQFLAPRRT
jgi:hypothetical protein